MMGDYIDQYIGIEDAISRYNNDNEASFLAALDSVVREINRENDPEKLVAREVFGGSSDYNAVLLTDHALNEEYKLITFQLGVHNIGPNGDGNFKLDSNLLEEYDLEDLESIENLELDYKDHVSGCNMLSQIYRILRD